MPMNEVNTSPEFALRRLGVWGLRWGVPLLAVVLVQPSPALWVDFWLPLHSILEIFSVIVAGMIFMVGRNAVVFSGTRVGARVGTLFLFAALMDTAHLLAFPGMPVLAGQSPEARGIVFWLLARLAMAAGLLSCVVMDWSRGGSGGRWMLPTALVAAPVALLLSMQLVSLSPELFWSPAGPTTLKLVLEGGVTLALLLALVLELRGSGRKVPYEHDRMVQALLTLIASELCILGYSSTDDVFILMGHLYKVIGCYLLYGALVEGMIREPYRRLARAEEAAVARSRELDALFQSAPDGVMLVDAAGQISRINPRFTELMGYEQEQIEGLPVEILLPQRYRGPHRQYIRDYMLQPRARAMGAGRELYARHRDGTEFPVDISLSAVKIEGRLAVIATLRDVSERVALVRSISESEVRTRSFLDNSVDWVWETNPGGSITYSSQRVADHLGYAPEEVVGRSLLSLMVESDAIQLGSQLREIVVRREPMLNIQHANRTRDGAVRQMETNARPYHAADGRFLGYRGVTRDVTQQQQLQQALERSERIFRHAFDDFPTGMALVDCYGTLIRTNLHFTKMVGVPGESLTGVELASLIHVADRRALSAAVLDLCDGKVRVYSGDLRLERPSGELRWMRLDATLVDLKDGSLGPVMLMVSDVSAEKEAASQKERLLAIIERMADTVAVVDLSGRNLYMNPYGRRMLGIDLDEDLTAESIRNHHPARIGEFIMERALPHAKKYGFWEGETVWLSRSGEEIATWQVIMSHCDPSGEVQYWTTVARDIRERKMLEERLSHQATHDALTGLPNRLLLRDRLQQAIIGSRRERRLLAVVFIDLDNFKRINDTLGHGHGDQVLIEVARRLRLCLRATDTLARQGGDEFIAVLSGLSTVTDAIGIVEKMVNALSADITIGERQVYVTASLGVSMYPFDHDSGDELLRKADVAMYRAKEHGRNGYQFYTADMDEHFGADLQTEIDLRHAIANGELLLHYQPKLSLAGDAVTGFEALVRWKHPERGVVSPVEFVPIAERSMLIAQLGEWVMREACRQIDSWRKEGLPLLPVAINVSAQQFEYTDVARVLRQCLTTQNLDGKALELEITEGVLMRDPIATARVLHQIRGLGVQIAVDDFGTGYSSLGYLKQFPVDVLKIDRSFIVGVPETADDTAIVRAIISMAHHLDIQVVAEGVETAAQVEFLRSCECDYVQGYVYARPMPADEVATFLKQADRSFSG